VTGSTSTAVTAIALQAFCRCSVFSVGVTSSIKASLPLFQKFQELLGALSETLSLPSFPFGRYRLYAS
jgi:hypothetical protein